MTQWKTRGDMKVLVLALSLAGLLLGAGDALAGGCQSPRHHHVHKKKHVHHSGLRNHSPYPVYSYSVPKFGAYSGYAFYDGYYPAYLPKWPRDAENSFATNGSDDDLPYQYLGNSNRNDLLRN
ncbi:hypothetical protein [Aestuariivirga litoralis]|uniref:hypothetical protein n=1 Tax=Aestuariivirga litoralis TaxID=2650924 RepID=UPI0018C6D420|nr:hypothetical protein [Aestuariivirga litoralis]MBG1231970.1 hypothetical protein [Aestuariivirga litoralis]